VYHLICIVSNTHRVDISAPGYPVLSTVDIDDSDDGSWYEYMSGTSMACPHVAGGLALAKSLSPTTSNSEVIITRACVCGIYTCVDFDICNE
jgi:subtilisin family serine protease